MSEVTELLIVDSDPRALEGLNQFFSKSGFLVTPISDGERAIELIAEKYFPVILLDFAIDNRSGMEILEVCRRLSPQSRVIFLTTVTNLKKISAAFRGGAFDVIHKEASQLSYLRERIAEAGSSFRTGTPESANLLQESKQLLEEIVTTLVDLAKQNLLLEGVDSIVSGGLTLQTLLIGPDESFAKLLGEHSGYTVTYCPTSDEGLDKLSQFRYDLVIARKDLDGIAGTILIKQAQKAQGDVLGMRLDEVNKNNVIVSFFSKGKELGDPETFRSPQDLMRRLDDINQRRMEMSRERRAIESVTRRNYRILKQYNNVRERLQQAIDATNHAR